MDVLTAIHSRRAVRDYRDEPVAADVIASLIDAAIWAPSGMNLQPWSFVIVDEAETLASCSDKAKELLRRSAADHPELKSLQSILASSKFNIFYNAPALIIVCATTSDEMALKDCCLAAQNLMLAATALELGTCWIGLAEAWLSTEEGKAALGIPSAFRPIAPMIVGRPNVSPAATTRRTADVRHVGMGLQP